MVYAAILPVLFAAHDPDARSVRDAYMALPAQDWVSWANRAGVLEQLDDLEGALRANAEALRLQPNHPGVQNNQCYILTRAGRAQEGIPYCEAALRGAPNVASVHHSYASALASAGLCERARQALAEARRLDPASVEYQHEIACMPAN
jgi:Flp pilus assembly protein TadD